jgi:hypothetical protein
MKYMRGFHISKQRPGQAHKVASKKVASKEDILRALAGGASVAKVARSFGVTKTLVRILVRRSMVAGGSLPTDAVGAVTRTQGHVKDGSMTSSGSQRYAVGPKKHGSLRESIQSHRRSPTPTRSFSIASPSLIRPAVAPLTMVGSKDMEHQIRALLIQHLGSENAADVWLNSTNTGYPTTALDVIRAGKGDLVLDDLENRWGPGPSYV